MSVHTFQRKSEGLTCISYTGLKGHMSIINARSILLSPVKPWMKFECPSTIWAFLPPITQVFKPFIKPRLDQVYFVRGEWHAIQGMLWRHPLLSYKCMDGGRCKYNGINVSLSSPKDYTVGMTMNYLWGGKSRTTYTKGKHGIRVMLENMLDKSKSI